MQVRQIDFRCDFSSPTGLDGRVNPDRRAPSPRTHFLDLQHGIARVFNYECVFEGWHLAFDNRVAIVVYGINLDFS